MNKKKGKLEKVYWEDIQKQAHRINPHFAEMIDRLSPNKQDYYFYKATYPYGAKVLETAVLQLPNTSGDIVPITDVSIEAQVKSDLEYNLNSNPVSMVLSNSFEIFYALETNTIPLSGLITSGSIFGMFRVLSPASNQQPKFLWDMTAGARSIFLLPKIAEEKRHYQLQKRFDVGEVPGTLMDHWQVFRDLANHPDFPQEWQAEILFFPKQWFEHLDEPSWMPFYYYLYRTAWNNTEFWRNQPFWHIIYSIILREFQRKCSAYIADTAKHLMHIGVGSQPGFMPATDNIAAPISGLQQVYYDTYGLRKYPLIFMTPAFFDLDDPQALPVYYSLQFPIASELGQSTRSRNSLIDDLHEVRSLLVRCESEILSGRFNVDNTPLKKMFQSVEFSCFHAATELRRHMKSSIEIMQNDLRFSKNLDGTQFPNFLSQKVAFLNGGVCISHKNFSKNV